MKVSIIIGTHNVDWTDEVSERRTAVENTELDDVIVMADGDDVFTMLELHQEFEAAFNDGPGEHALWVTVGPHV